MLQIEFGQTIGNDHYETNEHQDINCNNNIRIKKTILN